MFVKDIIDDAKDILGMCPRSVLYNRLTYAVETLANKGNWDALLGYLDITASGNVVTLPPQVETPLKININSNPSFTRSRLYEFTMNGPGNDMAETTGFSWMDKGTVPVSVQPSSPTALKATSNAADNGKEIHITGLLSSGLENTETLVLNSTTPPTTSSQYAEVVRVSKDVTQYAVTLATVGSSPLSVYQPNETEPQYRQIRLSKPAAEVKILFRRATTQITSDEDFIPLNSRMALILMLRALEGYRRSNAEDLKEAKALEEVAVQMCKEEQDSRSGFNIAETETQSPLDLNYNNSDSIIVADIYDDIAQLLGPVGRQKVFDFITETYQTLLNKGQWEGISDGYVDILTEDDQYVTLPRYVDIPLAINVGGMPLQFRNKWFEFHLNGPGSNCSGSCSHWDDIGNVVTLEDVSWSQQLYAQADLEEDEGLEIRVYGYYEDKWIQTEENGEMVDGFLVPVLHGEGFPNVGSQFIDRIERIVKPVSRGFISMTGWDGSQEHDTRIGYYWPDETVPNYRRIRLPCFCTWVRMRYRRRDTKVTSLTDPLHLRSKLAIMCMARSILSLKGGNVEESLKMEASAIRLLTEDHAARNPGAAFTFQFDPWISMASPEQGQY